MYFDHAEFSYLEGFSDGGDLLADPFV